MAFSGSISQAKFNALRVVETAFRRCRLPAQAITAEMQQYALDALYLHLSSLANGKVPSWCIEKLVLPMYQNQPDVALPRGTESVLNVNYRVIQPVIGGVTTTSTTYTVDFSSPTVVNTIGLKWAATAPDLAFQVSTDASTWRTVATQEGGAEAGEITWTDVSGALPYQFFRIAGPTSLSFASVTMGNSPQEIPLGALNRDDYVNQSNKVFPGRPSNYWYQRDIPEPLLHIWPAPFVAAEQAQLIVWRQRQIMDTQNLRQDVEVPQRWLDAIVARLAAKVAEETPSVDMNLIGQLEAKAAAAEQLARDGDNDGSPTYINPGIGCYTK